MCEVTNVFRIRRAVTADAGFVLACLEAAFAPYRESYTPGAFRDTVPSREGVEDRMERMSVLVATTAAGEIVGTLAYAATGTEGHLRGMAVLPAFLGHGVAAQLLSSAERDLREAGCTHVTLDTTLPLQRAIRFYRNHGYAPTGAASDFYGMPLFEYRKDL